MHFSNPWVHRSVTKPSAFRVAAAVLLHVCVQVYCTRVFRRRLTVSVPRTPPFHRLGFCTIQLQRRIVKNCEPMKEGRSSSHKLSVLRSSLTHRKGLLQPQTAKQPITAQLQNIVYHALSQASPDCCCSCGCCRVAVYSGSGACSPDLSSGTNEQ
jgi:hypothetical protein